MPGGHGRAVDRARLRHRRRIDLHRDPGAARRHGGASCQSLVYVALRTEALRGELDREWLARLNAEKVVPTLLWALFATICLVLPPLVFDKWHSVVTTVVALATGPASALLGKYSPVMPPQPGAPGARTAISFRVLADLAAAIFAVALFMVLARVGQQLTGGSAVGALVLIVIAGGLAWGLGRHINVNRFSMHAVYRNRLVRAFMGTARPERTPDPFTGFDPRDNPRMVDLAFPAPRKLFPVINVTLNVTEGERTAWSERKGESFTITPNACGAAYLLRKEDEEAGYEARGAYVKTSAYAGSEKETGRHDVPRGLSLGSAIASVRRRGQPEHGLSHLAGDGLPDDAVQRAARRVAAQPGDRQHGASQPGKAAECAGDAVPRAGRPVERSGQGGLSQRRRTFRESGLYEMVRRRCRHIVVVDAGADPDADFPISATPCTRSGSTTTSRSTSIRPLEIGSRQNPLKPFYWFACADHLSGGRKGRADLHQAVRPARHADGRARLSQRQRQLSAPADLRPVLRRDAVRELSPAWLLRDAGARRQGRHVRRSVRACADEAGKKPTQGTVGALPNIRAGGMPWLPTQSSGNWS